MQRLTGTTIPPILASLAGAAAILLVSSCIVATPATQGGAPPPRTADTTPPPRTDKTPPPRTDKTPPPRTAPSGGPVIDWRRGRLGRAASFTIEPTAGPAGTTVNIYGSFRPPVGGAVMCTFNGASPVSPYFVSVRRMIVRVPDNATSGRVTCSVGGQELWSGRFIVTRKVDDIFVPTDEQQGLLGAVYRIPTGTKNLPNFESLDPIATVVMPTVHVTTRRFDLGFPGLGEGDVSVREWYAVRFVGLIDATKEAEYTFKLKNSDGARLIIDDHAVIDNDGVHPPAEKEGKITLSQGKHRIVVEYFKGAGDQISLELWWKRGTSPFSGVAAHSLSRYTAEFDCSVQPVTVACCKALTPACKECSARAGAAMAAWQGQCGGN